jgi:hypothetical protein
MTVQYDRWPNEQDDAAGSPSAKASWDARRAIVLCTAAMLMLVAWQLSSAWTEPQSRRDHLLHALLLTLLAVLPVASRQKRDSLVASLSKSRIRRGAAAVLPLLVLFLFGWSQFMAARQRDAERQLALKREPWRQEVERQRNRVKLAEERVSKLLEKGKAASDAVKKASREVKTADGKHEFHADPSAMQKVKEALDEVYRAMNNRMEEEQRLFQLERERPAR